MPRTLPLDYCAHPPFSRLLRHAGGYSGTSLTPNPQNNVLNYVLCTYVPRMWTHDTPSFQTRLKPVNLSLTQLIARLSHLRNVPFSWLSPAISRINSLLPKLLLVSFPYFYVNTPCSKGNKT